MRVFVITNDKYLWAIKPFIYLFNIYWSELQELVVVGFSRPKFELPKNVTFISLSDTDYPAEKWSNGMIKLLQHIHDSHFVLMLEDYFIRRTVDHNCVRLLGKYAEGKPEILRIDLTNDRLHAKGDARDALDVESWGHYDIIETPHGTPYQMSLQAGIWNRKLLLELLKPDMSPWEVEINTQPPKDMRVLGTRQWPLRYSNAVKLGKIVQSEIDVIPEPHRGHIMKWIPRDFPR